MTPEQFHALQPGDIVRGIRSGEAYVVLANYGSRITAVRAVDMTNPDEWKLVLRTGGGTDAQGEPSCPKPTRGSERR
jgi:hypothetical protein